jgi:NitT/TauT family transport system permease protein
MRVAAPHFPAHSWRVRTKAPSCAPLNRAAVRSSAGAVIARTRTAISSSREGGLGYLLLIANGNMDTALLFAGIVALTVLGVVLFGLIGLLERLVLPPHAVERASFVRESM